jgi:tetratricopeptide (TPR) repeat protein
MKPNLRKIFILAGIAALILGAVWLTPRVLALYYQIRGGNLLERAQAITGTKNFDPLVCSNSTIPDRDVIIMIDRSLSYLNKAQERNSKASQIYLLMGRASCLLGNVQEAINSYEEYIKLRPKNPIGHLELGFANEYLCQRTSNLGSNINIGSPVDYCTENQDLRRSILEQWKTAGVTATMFLNAGNEAVEKGRFEEALYWYSRAGMLSPDDGKVWYETGLAYERMGELHAALEVYKQGLERNLLPRSGISSLYYRVGRMYQSNFPEAYLNQAKIAFETAVSRGDFVSGYEESDTHYRLGAILRREGSDPDGYIKEFESAIEIFPNHANAYILLGVSYYDLFSDIELAEQEFMHALKISPNNEWGYFQMGEIYRKEGNIKKAVDMYTQALKVDPNYEPAQRVLRDLLVEETQ